jgi:hypothetical protein
MNLSNYFALTYSCFKVSNETIEGTFKPSREVFGLSYDHVGRRIGSFMLFRMYISMYVDCSSRSICRGALSSLERLLITESILEEL